MPIDRAATLRTAEKLLRQGKLDAAIAEYFRVVDEFPRDWNTANVLGDLYVRAKQTGKAVEQFLRIADHLNAEGFYSKAAALYKKVLKLEPDHEHALVQGGEIAATQGLLADARAQLTAAAQLRRSRGDTRGVLQIRIRLGTMDPNDVAGRLDAARARAEAGEVDDAVRDLKAIAADLKEKGRDKESLDALREASALRPGDTQLREQLLPVYLAAGDFASARECATTADQLKAIAAALSGRGADADALDVLRDAARLDPADTELRAQLARAFAARGDLRAAAEYLTAEAAGDDPQLRLTMAEIQLRSGRVDDALAVLRELVEQDADRREAVAVLGWTVAEDAPDAGFRVVELAADSAVAGQDWAGAAAALQELVTRVPNHIPALMRLVEICVDGGLEATMFSAQAQLADAYLAAGSGSEARVISEDLVAREPWERANIERFRRALVMLGETDPDAVIAERLSGQSPFMSTDPLFEDLPDLFEAPSAPRSEPVPAPQPAPAADPEPATVSVAAPAAAPRAAAEPIEIDLSVVFEDIEPGGQATAAQPIEAADLESAFAQLRAEATPSAEGAEQYKRGLALRDAGRFDEAVEALRAASRSPRHRFHAATTLARMFRERDNRPQAIEWLERAAQVAAPTADESHRLLYELAELLESSGEVARALAVCLELQADAGEYRDVAARIARLSKVQTRG